MNRKHYFEFVNTVNDVGIYGIDKLGGWVIRRYDNTPFGAKDIVKPLKLKTKEEALKFAINWMKRHPRG